MLFFVANQRMFGWGGYGLPERHPPPGRLSYAKEEFGDVVSRLPPLAAPAERRELRWLPVTGIARFLPAVSD